MRRFSRKWAILTAIAGPATLMGVGCSLGARDALLAGAYDFITSTTTTALQSMVDAATANATGDTTGGDSASAQNAP